jgi:hypothetical protein
MGHVDNFHIMKNKKTATTQTPRARSRVAKVMHEYKEGELHTGSKKGPKVKSRKQAIAIALSEAGVSKNRGSKKKSASAKKSPKKKTVKKSSKKSSRR